MKGLCHTLLVFEIGSITASMTPVEVKPVLKLFGGEIPDLSYVRRPVGAVDLLLGVHNAGLMPVVVELERHRVGNLRILTSIFGTGMLLDGVHPALSPSAMHQTKEAFDRSHSVMGGIKYEAQPVKVINSVIKEKARFTFQECEEMGTAQPRRCGSCNSCIRCSVRVQELTW